MARALHFFAPLQGMSCVTLLSDFGLQDASASVAKGILMQYLPQAAILGISHEVMPFHRRQAAYLLGIASNKFPAGTCHVILVDVFSEKEPKLLLTEHNGHYFLCADNGIVSLANGTAADLRLCYELKNGDTYINWLHAIGAVIKQLQLAKPATMDLPIYTPKHTLLRKPKAIDNGTLECEVIHIDHYGNVVLNITKDELAASGNSRAFRIQFKRVEDIDTLSTGYTDVREGYKLARFNSNGFLEICINRGNAASLFGLRLGGKNNDIKLFFE